MENIDDILNESSAPSAPQAAQAGAVDGIDDILGEMPAIDEITGEELPEGLNGKSPQSAINKSPLSALDRFKLSMGNEAGNIDYLKKRFDAVQPILDAEGKPTSELAVMQNGKWYRTDANNGDIRDAYDLAKAYVQNPSEFLGDLADLGPMGIAAGIAATPAGAGLAAAGGTLGVAGAAAAAGASVGALTAGIRTSLGRIVGTYDATPEEQVKDIAFETLLNAAGNTIAVGVKPTAKWVAGRLESIADAFTDTKLGGAAINAPKAAFKKVFSALSVGEDNFDTMLEHPLKVRSTMEAAHQASGGNVSAYHDQITGQQIEQVKRIAQGARGTLTQIYGKMKDKLLQSVPETFSANYDDAIQSSYAGALEKGIGKIIVGEGQNAVEKTGADAAEYLAKNGLRGARFSLLSQKEMSNAVKAGAALKDEMGYLAVDSEAYAAVSGYFDDLARFANSAKSSGKQAAENLLNFKKIASDRAMAITNMEKVRDIPNVRHLINQSRAGVDKAIHNGLKEAGVAGNFVEMNGTYSALAEKFAPLLNANYRFDKSGDPKVYETLLGQFLARPGKQVTNKFAVDAAIDAASEHGLGGLAKQLANSKLRIQVGEAAKAFNPLSTESSRRMTQIGLSGVGGAVATGNPAWGAVIGAGMALRSPMTAKAGVNLAQAAFKGQQMLSRMPKSQIAQFMSSPEALTGFTSAILQAPAVRDQVSNQLGSVIQSQGPQGGQ